MHESAAVALEVIEPRREQRGRSRVESWRSSSACSARDHRRCVEPRKAREILLANNSPRIMKRILSGVLPG